MRPILFAFAPALLLAACQSAPPISAGQVAAQADLTIGEIEQRYRDAKAFADLLAPFMSPATLQRVQAAEVIVERALLAARAAATLVGRVAALREAKTATDQISVATGVPVDSVPQAGGPI